MSKIKNILKFAMRMEKDAEDFYTYYMDKAESDSTKKLFEELAVIEKHHYEILKSKFDELGFEEPPLSISWVVDNNFAAKDPNILSINSDVSGNPENEISDLNIIRMAYLIENDFSLFYKNAIASVEEPEAKEFLNVLSGWENQHREMFQERYQILLQKHWSDISSVIFPK
jgi:rubrerythrin